jgi:hypothetical protein
LQRKQCAGKESWGKALISLDSQPFFGRGGRGNSKDLGRVGWGFCGKSGDFLWNYLEFSWNYLE